MNICHLATKSFDEDVIIRRSVVYNGTPLVIGRTHIEEKDGVVEETIQFNKSMPDEVNIIKSLEEGRQAIMNSPLGVIVQQNVLPLSSLYDYRVSKDDLYSTVLPVGATFNDIFEAEDTRQYMCEVASIMFPHLNPNTSRDDIVKDAFYTPYIPLVTLTGCIPPQVRNEEAYFNPNGVVTVAEYLDGLNSIKYGCNANNKRKKTLDNISNDSDYFNEGYQSCLRGISSPFFNLYTREELIQPITRMELAYITVLCWKPFIEKYNRLYGGSFYLGITFDWEIPSGVLDSYEDGYDYKVSKISIDKEYDIVSLDVKDYRSDRSMSEYKEDMKSGISAVPMPMFMSMLELGVLDLFFYEGKMLHPLKEVSRGEFCYFLAKLAKLFPTKYINNN